MRFPGTKWYVVTVRSTQTVRDQKKFGKHCSRKLQNAKHYFIEGKMYKNNRISETTRNCFNINLAMCNIYRENLFAQNVTKVIFIFETSPSIKSKDKNVRDMRYYFPTA